MTPRQERVLLWLLLAGILGAFITVSAIESGAVPDKLALPAAVPCLILQLTAVVCIYRGTGKGEKE